MKPSTNSVGNWTPHEDEFILRYVFQKEQNNDSMMWNNLENELKTRSGKSCRERWFNNLDPKIKRSAGENHGLKKGKVKDMVIFSLFCRCNRLLHRTCRSTLCHWACHTCVCCNGGLEGGLKPITRDQEALPPSLPEQKAMKKYKNN